MLRSWLLFHFASGQAFFLGTAMIVAAVVLSGWSRRPGARRVRNASAAVGVILVICSATPLPLWNWAGLAAVTLVWVILEAVTAPRDAQPPAPANHAQEPPAEQRLADEASKRRRTGARPLLFTARILAVLAWGTAAAVELPWHLVPRLPPVESPVLAVIGDSVTAGIGEHEAVTWPRRLAADHDLTVDDFSQMGATVASARRQAARLRPEHNLILLEIGGNDLLGSTTAAQFEAGLDRLLREIRQPGRTVLMFELPLPPTFNRFGAIQRRLASQPGLLLVPKRIFMSVLCRGDTTLDSIHLSQSGHDELAEAVWAMIGDACEPARQGSK